MRHRFRNTFNYIFNETHHNATTIGQIFITTTINSAYNLYLICWCQKQNIHELPGGVSICLASSSPMLVNYLLNVFAIVAITNNNTIVIKLCRIIALKSRYPHDFPKNFPSLDKLPQCSDNNLL